MKISKRLIVAVVLVGLLSVTAIGTWAAPGRQGTVPVVPQKTTAPLNETVNLGTSTVEVDATASAGGTLTVEKVADPATKIGEAPTGWEFLLDQALDISITGGTMTSVQVCVPQTPDMEAQTTTFHFWDAVKKVWVAIPTVVTTGTPALVCGSGSAEGQYALMGK
jgi:hypothetical protein